MRSVALIVTILSIVTSVSAQRYCWHRGSDAGQSIASRFEVPEGYERIEASQQSFGHWLRNLPLKEDGADVLLYNGDKKWNQWAHCAVVDIDVGNTDLQQCADAVIRLRAEYFYSRGLYDSISFNFTSGDEAIYRNWIKGMRPKISGNNVTWSRTAGVDSSYSNFRDYLNTVFTYAGSYSLNTELKLRSDPCQISIGDVFIQGGFPGHAVIVVDVAVDKTSGKRMFLLAQSYMPAQEIHILKNPYNASLSPWYDCDFGDRLTTPEWTFESEDLKQW